MGSGTSSHLTREECNQLVPACKWDENWDEFYFADGKNVSSEIAERVWAKSERWEAYIATGHATAEPIDSGSDKRGGSEAADAPVERVADTREASDGAARYRTRADVTADSTNARQRRTKELWKKGIAKIGWITHANARAAALDRARLAGISTRR